MDKIQLILVGGFLGAGKTTAIMQAVAHRRQEGIVPVVITNDQGQQLVDTGLLQANNIPTGEVTGGCFCCNFPQLEAVLVQLQQEHKATCVFAESVGSCTDLVATVVKPMQALYPQVQVSLSVLADATVLYTHLQANQFFFKKNVQYIYQKQLEEADVIVVTKMDRLPEALQQRVKDVVRKSYPSKSILFQNSYRQSDIVLWLQTLDGLEPVQRASLQINYDLYGAGEAELAWLNAALLLRAETGADRLCEAFITSFKKGIAAKQWPVGHLKFLWKNETDANKISLTVVDDKPVSVFTVGERKELYLIVNARIQCPPAELEWLLQTSINHANEAGQGTISVEDKACFEPGYPVPTHRIA